MDFKRREIVVAHSIGATTKIVGITRNEMLLRTAQVWIRVEIATPPSGEPAAGHVVPVLEGIHAPVSHIDRPGAVEADDRRRKTCIRVDVQVTRLAGIIAEILPYASCRTVLAVVEADASVGLGAVKVDTQDTAGGGAGVLGNVGRHHLRARRLGTPSRGR